MTKLKLGTKVIVSKVLVKSHEYLPGNYELMTPEQKEKWEGGDPIWVQKRVVKELEKPKEGIVVGKRKISIANLLDWNEGDYWDGEFFPDVKYRSIETTFESVYLVACNLKGFCYVSPDDLEAVEG